MPSSYLQAGEYTTYGLAPTTTDAAVQQASILVDSYLKRPEGLVYVADSVGNPIYMKSLPTTTTFTLTSQLNPGTNSAATVAGPLQTLKRGTVLIADKSTPANAEVLTVSSVSGNQVVFTSVTKTHAAAVTLEGGLTIHEPKHLPTGRMVTLLSRTPVVQIAAAEGRYAPSRRGRYPFPQEGYYELASIATVFTGGAPVVESIDVSRIDFNPQTGEVWLPSGMYATPYTDVNIAYLSGFTDTTIPSTVKQVVANIIQVQIKSPLAGNLKLMRAGDTQIERFMATLLGADERSALEPYVAKAYA